MPGSVFRSLQAALAETFLLWAVKLDPSDDPRVIGAYAALAEAKLDQLAGEAGPVDPERCRHPSAFQVVGAAGGHYCGLCLTMLVRPLPPEDAGRG